MMQKEQLKTICLDTLSLSFIINEGLNANANIANGQLMAAVVEKLIF